MHSIAVKQTNKKKIIKIRYSQAKRKINQKWFCILLPEALKMLENHIQNVVPDQKEQNSAAAIL